MAAARAAASGGPVQRRRGGRGGGGRLQPADGRLPVAVQTEGRWQAAGNPEAMTLNDLLHEKPSLHLFISLIINTFATSNLCLCGNILNAMEGWGWSNT
uniref:Uncharacterized protein n=1 Tax=Oryza sativa subsp. japonica TaxID=39947 RepID=Q69KZ8_ORYSJ|nr:hypothetical protein [Oryza sativa Japonica Group]